MTRTIMPRSTSWAALFVLAMMAAVSAVGQELQVLRIVVTAANPSGVETPAARHALLISDDPPSRAPRQVTVKSDGTVDVRLRPGRYIVESDRPLVFGGKSYSWSQVVEVAAGGSARLELNSTNAEVTDGALSSASDATAPAENDPSFLLSEWRDSVMAIWTSTARVSGFLADASGLILTNQRAIGDASLVEVQFSSSTKVEARVLTADRARDVAVLWVDPSVTASLRPLAIDCAEASIPQLADGQRLVAIGAPLRGQKEVAVGELVKLGPRSGGIDFRFARGGTGGPVFTSAGRLAGLSSPIDDPDAGRRSDARVVPLDDVCQGMRDARAAMETATRPSPARLPVEPAATISLEALDAAVQRRTGSPRPPQMTSSDFDVVFLTPVAIRAAQLEQQAAGARPGASARPMPPPGGSIVPTDFGEWSDYFEDLPSVLTVRITPRLTEGFWMKVARGAAYTQGAALPPIKRFRPGFSRLEAYCGDAEVRPIHRLTIEQRVSETDAIREGLYVFDPQTFGPHCASVRLALYSEKEPRKADTRPVDAKVLDQVREELTALVTTAKAGLP